MTHVHAVAARNTKIAVADSTKLPTEAIAQSGVFFHLGNE